MIESIFAQLTQIDSRILSQVLVVVGVAIVATIFIVRRLAPRRRQASVAILHALDESSRSHLAVIQPRKNGDFVAIFDPAPDPFSSLSLTRVCAPLGGTGIWRRRGQAKFDQLRFEGILAAPVKAELLWGRGRIPGRALRRRKGVDLWDQHCIDLTGSEYVVRGSNTGAIQHAFFNLQQRFNPFLQEVAIGAESEPNLILTVAVAYGFNAESTPALLRLVRATARAARLE